MSSWRFKYLGERSLLINELMEHLNQKAVDMKQSRLATAYKSCTTLQCTLMTSYIENREQLFLIIETIPS